MILICWNGLINKDWEIDSLKGFEWGTFPKILIVIIRKIWLGTVNLKDLTKIG